MIKHTGGQGGTALQSCVEGAPLLRNAAVHHRRARGSESNAPVRRRSRHAFTIIEVIVIVVILGVLAAIIAPRLLGRIGQSKRAVAEANAASLASAFKLFMADSGRAPESGTTLDVLWTRPGDLAEGEWRGPYVDSADDLMDPWGNKFVLLMPSQHGHADFDIVSYGADGAPGGEGDDEDIIKP